MNVKRRIVCVILSFFVFGIFFNRPARALTVKDEITISREFMRYIYQNYEIIEDPEIAGYIQALGDELLSYFPPQPFKYRFYVIKNETYNAFAGPGGRIFIHSGLFEALKKEEELAGIVGHEIAHVACRHISDSIERSKKIGIGTLAGIAAGIFLSIYGDPAAGGAVTMGSIAGSQSISLAYSREAEMQSDQMGVKYLVEAGYSPEGLITALDKIRSRQWFGQEQIPTYLTTHPAPEDRMAYLKNWMGRNKDALPKDIVKDSFDFNMAHTKLIALYGNADEGKKHFLQILEKEPDNLYALYGYGISLSRVGKPDESIRYLKMAVEKRAFHVGMLITLGQVYFNAGYYENAKSIFEGALSIVPNSFECTLYYGRTLTELGRLDEAIDYLRPFSSEENGEIRAYYYLGDIYARKGMLPESYYYLGLYYRNKRDIKNALRQFDRALKLTKDPVLKTKIQTRINELRGDKNDIKKNEKKKE